MKSAGNVMEPAAREIVTRDFEGFWGGIRGEDAVVGGADFTGTSE